MVNFVKSLGYYIEKRERGGEWIKANNYPTPNTTFNVQDLRENARYEFRVIAVNEAGPGKPSKPSESITAKEQKSKYNLTHKAMIDQSCSKAIKSWLSCGLAKYNILGYNPGFKILTNPF